MIELSVVVPVHNEEGNIEALLTQIKSALNDYVYEIVIVDDGSTDGTCQYIKFYADDEVKLIVLNRNYGQTAALAAGIREAKGKYIVTMDGDLQNDPKDIPLMLEKLKGEDWDVVAGNRKDRSDQIFLRKIPSAIANYL